MGNMRVLHGVRNLKLIMLYHTKYVNTLRVCKLTPWNGNILEKLMGPHLDKKIPELYGNRMSITLFIRDHEVLLQCQDGQHTHAHTQ